MANYFHQLDAKTNEEQLNASNITIDQEGGVDSKECTGNEQSVHQANSRLWFLAHIYSQEPTSLTESILKNLSTAESVSEVSAAVTVLGKASPKS